MAQRGNLLKIYCDSASDFKGMSEELEQARKDIEHSEIN